MVVRTGHLFNMRKKNGKSSLDTKKMCCWLAEKYYLTAYLVLRIGIRVINVKTGSIHRIDGGLSELSADNINNLTSTRSLSV